MLDNTQLATKLTKKYSDQFTATRNRTFGLPKARINSNEWIFRRLITNVMVAGSNEDNVITATKEIFKQYPKMKDLAAATQSSLVEIMNRNNVRFSGRKANNIIDIAISIITQECGIVPHDRATLEAMPRVGRHTASTVLSLAFDMPSMGVDLHVRRIAKRIGLVGEKATDKKIEDILSKDVDAELLAQYSRAFVEFGKEICGFDPDCAKCFLKAKCPTAQGTVKVTKKAETVKVSGKKVVDGRYGIVAGSSDREYFVTVSGDKASCNCKGYRFKRTCSHVKEIAG